jgi:site-specific recombinase XerD
LSIGNRDNAATIVNYIAAMKIEINLSDHYRKDLIELLTRLRFNNEKNFKDITRYDIIAFLDTYRKTEASACNGLITLSGQDTFRKP